MSSKVTWFLMAFEVTLHNSSNTKTIPISKAKWQYSPFYHPLLSGTGGDQLRERHQSLPV